MSATMMKTATLAAAIACLGAAARADPPTAFDARVEQIRGAVDHYLEQPRYDWAAAWQEVVRQRDERAVALLKKQTSTPARVGPSLPLERYAGAFADAWYGPIAIEYRDGRLTMDFKQTPGMTGRLTHWQYDTFRIDWRDSLIEPAYVTFALQADGSIDRISMRAVSPLADFSFDYQDLDLRPLAKE